MLTIKTLNLIQIDVLDVGAWQRKALQKIESKISDTLSITLGMNNPEFSISIRNSPFMGKPRMRIKLSGGKQVSEGALHSLMSIVRKMVGTFAVIHISQATRSFLDGMPLRGLVTRYD